MPPNLAEDEVLQARLGVSADTPDGEDLGRLNQAVSHEIRRLARRGFEGDEGATYDEIYRLEGAREFVLRHTPVGVITSIRRHHFDGTEDDPWEATTYRVENADRGLVVLRHTADRVRVVHTVSGEITTSIRQAAEDWIAARWTERDRAGLASYATGGDSESYFASLAGLPPRSVAATLRLHYHATGGGPI